MAVNCLPDPKMVFFVHGLDQLHRTNWHHMKLNFSAETCKRNFPIGTWNLSRATSASQVSMHTQSGRRMSHMQERKIVALQSVSIWRLTISGETPFVLLASIAPMFTEEFAACSKKSIYQCCTQSPRNDYMQCTLSLTMIRNHEGFEGADNLRSPACMYKHAYRS